jgi:hypothetical protein
LACSCSGDCVCNACSSNSMVIKHIDTVKKQRVCDNCFAGASKGSAPRGGGGAGSSDAGTSSRATAAATPAASSPVAAPTAAVTPVTAASAAAVTPRSTASTAAASQPARASPAVSSPLPAEPVAPASGSKYILPAGWDCATADDGRVYYFHEETGVTSCVTCCVCACFSWIGHVPRLESVWTS